MKIKTRKFGEIDIAEEKIITMPMGLPGFPGCRRFVLLELQETRPFCWYQSADDPNLVLVVMNPQLFQPDYRADYRSAIREMEWKDTTEEDMAIYVVLTVNETGPNRITANMMGPIVINTKQREAVQLIHLDGNHSLKHPIMPPSQKNPPVQESAL